MRFVDEHAHDYSEQLAGERGSFPNWAGSLYDTKFKRPMRNATCTTVAPTGTISIIAGCSGGSEPLYSLAFFRNVLRGQAEGQTPMAEINPIFEAVARKHGFLSEGLMERVATDGTLAQIEEPIPSEVRRVFVCAHDIAPDWHMRMQAAFQKHCDASISKTINFPESASVEEVIAVEETRQLVVHEVLTLREPYRSVILQRFWSEQRPKEIAAAKGVPESTVRNHLHRGLAELRRKLEKRQGDQDLNRSLWLLSLPAKGAAGVGTAVVGTG